MQDELPPASDINLFPFSYRVTDKAEACWNVVLCT